MDEAIEQMGIVLDLIDNSDLDDEAKVYALLKGISYLATLITINVAKEKVLA